MPIDMTLGNKALREDERLKKKMLAINAAAKPEPSDSLQGVQSNLDKIGPIADSGAWGYPPATRGPNGPVVPGGGIGAPINRNAKLSPTILPSTLTRRSMQEQEQLARRQSAATPPDGAMPGIDLSRPAPVPVTGGTGEAQGPLINRDWHTDLSGDGISEANRAKMARIGATNNHEAYRAAKLAGASPDQLNSILGDVSRNEAVAGAYERGQNGYMARPQAPDEVSRGRESLIAQAETIKAQQRASLQAQPVQGDPNTDARVRNEATRAEALAKLNQPLQFDPYDQKSAGRAVERDQDNYTESQQTGRQAIDRMRENEALQRKAQVAPVQAGLAASEAARASSEAATAKSAVDKYGYDQQQKYLAGDPNAPGENSPMAIKIKADLESQRAQAAAQGRDTARVLTGTNPQDLLVSADPIIKSMGARLRSFNKSGLVGYTLNGDLGADRQQTQTLRRQVVRPLMEFAKHDPQTAARTAGDLLGKLPTTNAQGLYEAPTFPPAGPDMVAYVAELNALRAELEQLAGPMTAMK